MLVLSRRPNQSIVISSDIVVTVIEIRGDQVRLGIKAPREVTVHRDEVAAEIQSANEAASFSEHAVSGSLPRPPSGDAIGERPSPRSSGPQPGR